MSKSVLTGVLIALAASLQLPTHADAFKVCGYYCGPDWCADTVITEQSCVATGVWGSPSDGGCADSCCRVHDYCCGEGSDRPACNSALVGCLQSSRCYLSLCGAAVWAAMKMVTNWCCGSTCPTAHLAESPNILRALVGKQFCFAREASHPSRVLEAVPGMPILSFGEATFTLLPSATGLNTGFSTAPLPEVYFVDNTTNEVILGGSSSGADKKVVTFRGGVAPWSSEVTKAVLAAPPLRMLETSASSAEKAFATAAVNPSVVYLPQVSQLSIVTSAGDQKIMIEC